MTSCPSSCSCALIQIECGPGLHRDSRWSHVGKPLLDRLRGGSEASPINYFSILVEGAVMAPDIAKVDADRDLDLGLPASNFSDGVLRWLLHGNSLLLLRRTCSSHFPVLIRSAGLNSCSISALPCSRQLRTENYL